MKDKVDYTVDLLIFGISNKENENIRELSKKNLSIILLKRDKEPYKDMLVLPGGYVNNNETSEEAAKRVLEKETGLTNIDLYLTNVNDEVKRDPRNRTVSVSYMALVDVSEIKDELKENSKWYDLSYCFDNNNVAVKLDNDLVFTVGRKIIDLKSNNEKYYLINKNKLGFDHEIILVKGLMDLRNRVKNTDIIFNLFPKSFTIGALEQVYGKILNEKVINSAFRRVFSKKIKATSKMVKTGGHRPSYLYEYSDNKNLREEEMVDIYNPETMKKTNEITSKTIAHSFGLWHSSIHLIIVNKDKTMTLFQQRASNKKLYPNAWDIAVGGHISAGETDEQTVKRELEEELGINPNNYDIEFIKKYNEELLYNSVDSKEVVSVFIMYADLNIKDIRLQKEEVENAKWINKEEMKKLIEEGKTIPHEEEYKLLYDILK